MKLKVAFSVTTRKDSRMCENIYLNVFELIE